VSIEIDLLNVDGETEPRVVRGVITGKLGESDYQVLETRVEQILERHASVRMIAQLSEFEGWTAGAAWEDARLSLRHYSDFERLAIVGDARWQEWMTAIARPFSLAEVRFFEPVDMEQALTWITEPAPGNLQASVDEARRVVHVRPGGRLSKQDFLSLAERVNPLVAEWGRINGLVIESRDFPGWESIGALIHHLRFVSDHHRHIGRIALVTDSVLGSIAEHITSHFINARIKQFAPADLDIALDWAAKPDAGSTQTRAD